MAPDSEQVSPSLLTGAQTNTLSSGPNEATDIPTSTDAVTNTDSPTPYAQAIEPTVIEPVVVASEQKHRQSIFSVPAKMANKPDVFANSIIQMLNRWVPDEESGVYFNAGPFEATAPKWEGIPIVFANAHPDLQLFEDDPASALKQVKGRIVGKASNIRFIQEGHPHLVAALQVNDDECSVLFKQGELSLSTAFWAFLDGECGIAEGIEPNHILLFKEDGYNMPKDRGALVKNMQSNPDSNPTTELSCEPAKGGCMEQAPQTHAGRVISGENEGELRSLIDKFKALIDRMTGAANTSGGSNAGDTPQIVPDEDVLATPGSGGSTDIAKELSPSGDAPVTPPQGYDPNMQKVEPSGIVEAEVPVPNEQKNTEPTLVEEIMTQTDKTVTPEINVSEFTETVSGLTQKLADAGIASEKTALELSQKDVTIGQLNIANAEQASVISAKEAELANATSKIASLEAQIVERDTAIANATVELNDFKQKAADAKFDTFLLTIKPGAYAQAEDKASLRAEFDNDPQALLMKIANMVATEASTTEKEGAKFVQSTAPGAVQTKKLGTWNPYKQAWE